MRYTEQKSEMNFNSFYDYVRAIVILAVIGPLRFVKEVSTKIIFLSRESVRKVLFVACVLQIAITVLQIGLNVGLFEKSFSLTSGVIPVIVHLMSLAVLVALYFWYTTTEFIIYQQLDKFLPVVMGVSAEVTQDTSEESTQDSRESHVSDFSDLENLLKESSETVKGSSKSSYESHLDLDDELHLDLDDDLHLNLDDDFLRELDSGFLDALESVELNDPGMEPVPIADLASQIVLTPQSIENTSKPEVLEKKSNDADSKDNLINHDVYEDKSVFEFKHSFEESVRKMTAEKMDRSTLSAESKRQLREDMENSRDPSKYLSEESLSMFINTIGTDNFGSIDDFSNWCTPNDFPLVS